MSKTPIKVNEYFEVQKDEEGNEIEVIYNPPLLAETKNIKIELRKEKKHGRAHVHVIKKGRKKSHEVSIALDNFDILAGHGNLKHFDKNEFEKIAEFLAENSDLFKELYEKLRGEI